MFEEFIHGRTVTCSVGYSLTMNELWSDSVNKKNFCLSDSDHYCWALHVCVCVCVCVCVRRHARLEDG